MFEVVEHAGRLRKLSSLLKGQITFSLLAIHFLVILVYQLLACTVKISSLSWWHFLHDGLSIHLIIDGIKILYTDFILHFEVYTSLTLTLNDVRQYGCSRLHVHIGVF